MRKGSIVMASCLPEEIKAKPQPTSAFDTNLDPYAWRDKPEGQRVSGGPGFAELREDMNRRRRQTARRMTEGSDSY